MKNEEGDGEQTGRVTGFEMKVLQGRGGRGGDRDSNTQPHCALTLLSWLLPSCTFTRTNRWSSNGVTLN